MNLIGSVLTCIAATYSVVQAFGIYRGQRYVELLVNDTFILSCSAQNVSDPPLHSNEAEERMCLDEKEIELVLSFKGIKETDTGNYSCTTANGTQLYSIYVFVADPEQSQIFITEPNMELTSNGTHLVIPCRTNRMIADDQVRLHVQRSWIRNVPFDPRKGFIIALERLQNLKSTKFRCSYRQHISQQFTYAGSPRNERPMISTKDWPVVEDKVTVECIIQVDDPSQYIFEWLSPEEENATAEGHVVPQEGIMWTRIIIPKSTKNDQGNYTCNLKNKTTGENITSSTVFVHVGIRMGQARLYNASYVCFDTDSDQLQFTTFVDVYGEEHEYWRNWTKYIGDLEEELSPEESARITFSIEKGVHKEQISFNISTTLNYNYTAFGLEIHVPFYVLNILKKTALMMSLRIFQNGREIEGLADPLSNLTIVCSTITSLQATGPELLLRRYGEEHWTVMKTIRVSPTDVAFTSRMQYEAHVSCDNGFKKVTRHVGVLPWIETRLLITPSPGKIIDDKEIHEGDTVTLNCTALTAQTKELQWYDRKLVLLKNRTMVDADGEFLSMPIVKRISKDDEGLYWCVAKLLDNSIIADFKRVAVVGGSRKTTCSTIISFSWTKDGKALCSENEFTAMGASRIEKASFECIRNGFLTEEELTSLFYSLVAMAVVGALMLILLISTVVYARGRNTQLQRLRKLHSMLMEHEDIALINRALPLHEQVERLPYDGNYEIKLERLMITKVLSSGHYGRVYVGKLQAKTGKETMDVAVKGCKDTAKYVHMKALVDELRIMIAIGTHPNVLCLIGAVTENIQKGDDVYVIMELCERDLKNFLCKNRDILMRQHTKKEEEVGGKQPKDYYLIPSDNMLKIEEDDKYKSSSSLFGYISLSKNGMNEKISVDLLSFAYQIANGMEYLAGKMCVHRDLAARNILLTQRRLVRIADFGLARQCDERTTYQVRTFSLPLPYKSMAPECISKLHFTEKSDIWSYGILLWEIFSFGEDPYKNFDDVEKLTEFHETGGRLQRPEYIPEKIAELMFECWNIKPEERPNFSKCRQKTEEIFRSSCIELYESLQMELMNEVNEMKRYAEWRDGRRHSRVKKGRKLVEDTVTAM